MTAVEIILFLLGMSISVQFIAALFGFIDLKYSIKTRYPVVIRRVMAWGCVTMIIALVMRDSHRNAFLLGFAAFVFLHIALFIIGKLITARPIRR